MRAKLQSLLFVGLCLSVGGTLSGSAQVTSSPTLPPSLVGTWSGVATFSQAPESAPWRVELIVSPNAARLIYPSRECTIDLSVALANTAIDSYVLRGSRSPASARLCFADAVNLFLRGDTLTIMSGADRASLVKRQPGAVTTTVVGPTALADSMTGCTVYPLGNTNSLSIEGRCLSHTFDPFLRPARGQITGLATQGCAFVDSPRSITVSNCGIDGTFVGRAEFAKTVVPAPPAPQADNRIAIAGGAAGPQVRTQTLDRLPLVAVGGAPQTFRVTPISLRDDEVLVLACPRPERGKATLVDYTAVAPGMPPTIAMLRCFSDAANSSKVIAFATVECASGRTPVVQGDVRDKPYFDGPQTTVYACAPGYSDPLEVRKRIVTEEIAARESEPAPPTLVGFERQFDAALNGTPDEKLQQAKETCEQMRTRPLTARDTEEDRAWIMQYCAKKQSSLKAERDSPAGITAARRVLEDSGPCPPVAVSAPTGQSRAGGSAQAASPRLASDLSIFGITIGRPLEWDFCFDGSGPASNSPGASQALGTRPTAARASCRCG